MTEQAKCRLAASMVVLDPDGRVLVVREADPCAHGKVNLPGGHVEPGEQADICALRELREETGLLAGLSGLVGVYMNDGGINVVFLGKVNMTATTPGDDILACCWMSTEELRDLPDDEILRPKKLRQDSVGRSVRTELSGGCSPDTGSRRVGEGADCGCSSVAILQESDQDV